MHIDLERQASTAVPLEGDQIHARAKQMGPKVSPPACDLAHLTTHHHLQMLLFLLPETVKNHEFFKHFFFIHFAQVKNIQIQIYVFHAGENMAGRGDLVPHGKLEGMHADLSLSLLFYATRTAR